MRTMSDILQDQPVEELHSHETEPRLETILERLGEHSFTPLLMLVALPLALSQIGQVTLLTALVAIVVVAASVQMLLGWHHLHLPRAIRDLPVPQGLADGVTKLISAVVPDEEKTRKQFGYWITLPPFGTLPKVMILICGAVLPLSTGVYGMTNALALAVLLLSVGLLTRHGLWVLLGASCLSFASVLPAVAA